MINNKTHFLLNILIYKLSTEYSLLYPVDILLIFVSISNLHIGERIGILE